MILLKSTEFEIKSKEEVFEPVIFIIFSFSPILFFKFKLVPPPFKLGIIFSEALILESPVKVSVHLSPKILKFNSFSLFFSLFLFPNNFLFNSIVELAGVKILLLLHFSSFSIIGNI